MSAIIYLLQVSACLALFYGFYYLLLNRLTFFTINRYYLLFTLVLSFIIPLLTIPVHHQYTAAPVVQQVMQMRSIPTIPSYTFTPITAPIQTTSPITWMQLLNWSYLAAVAGLSIHLLITLFNFFIKLKRRKLSSLGNIHILRGDKKLPNGSFLNYIFLNDDALSAEEMEQIVAHEILHVKLYHSADRILMKLVQIVLWFNPLIYFYARSMEENHEFEVDREVARSTDKTKYADLLLHLSVANQGMLYHSFSKVPLKKRIAMLFSQPSAKVKRVVYILVLPVILISCLAFAKIKKIDIKIDLIKSGKEILSAIKTGQDNMVAQLNQPAQLLPDTIATINITPKPTTQIATNTILNKDSITVDYSEISELESPDLGKKPLVIIDGVEYATEILYAISKKCVGATAIYPKRQETIEKFGNNAIDGCIDIKTKNGEIIYMTSVEKENLYKEKSVSKSQFYTRLKLKKESGERYDYVVINLPGGNNHSPLEWRLSPNDKVAILIDDTLYDERSIKTIPSSLLAPLSGGSYGYQVSGNEKTYANGYKLIFYFTSKTNYESFPKSDPGSMKLGYNKNISPNPQRM